MQLFQVEPLSFRQHQVEILFPTIPKGNPDIPTIISGIPVIPRSLSTPPEELQHKEFIHHEVPLHPER